LPAAEGAATFSDDAIRGATRDGAPAIDPIDGELLCDLLRQLKLRVQIERVERPLADAARFSKV
jgi:restriction system protein